MIDCEYTNGTQFIPIGHYAKTRKQRRKGLSRMAIEQSPPEMIFEKCRSIHTFGMRFDLKVIFLDSKMKIIGSKNVAKNKLVFGPKGTYSIVELPLR